MYKMLVPLIFAGSVLHAAAVEPMAEACSRLVAALGQETAALQKMQTAADVSGALEDLRASLAALEALFEVDEKELWMYIDNTEGAKQPIVDELERLAVQFIRVSREKFFGNAELRNLLAPQVLNTPQKPRAKRGKLREIDHDE